MIITMSETLAKFPSNSARYSMILYIRLGMIISRYVFEVIYILEVFHYRTGKKLTSNLLE